MPNHCENFLTANGSKTAIENFTKKMIKVDKDNRAFFDFNEVVPMPEMMERASSDKVQTAKNFLKNKQRTLKEMQPLCWGKEEIETLKALEPLFNENDTMDKVIDYLKTHSSETLPSADDFELAQQIIDGHISDTDWYDWRVNNWGTKWNSYEVSIETGRIGTDKHYDDVDDGLCMFHISFLTAWCPPYQFYKAMIAQYPEIEFFIEYYELGCGIAGTYQNEGSRMIEHHCETEEEFKHFMIHAGGFPEDYFD